MSSDGHQLKRALDCQDGQGAQSFEEKLREPSWVFELRTPWSGRDLDVSRRAVGTVENRESLTRGRNH